MAAAASDSAAEEANREFVKTLSPSPPPSPESSTDEEEARRVELDLAALDIRELDDKLAGLDIRDEEGKKLDLASESLESKAAMAAALKKVDDPLACIQARETGTEKTCGRRLQRLSEDYIAWLKEQPPRYIPRPYRESKYPETLRALVGDELIEKSRKLHTAAVEACKAMRDIERDNLAHHAAYGYAYAWFCDCVYFDGFEEIV